MGNRIVHDMRGVHLYPLSIIETQKGNILKLLRSTDEGYAGFGEAYISEIKSGDIKGWIRHNKLALNLIVLSGCIEFVIYDDRKDSETYDKFFVVTLSPTSNHKRLTLESGLWMAFKGCSETTSSLIDIIPEPHDPLETDKQPLDNILYKF